MSEPRPLLILGTRTFAVEVADLASDIPGVTVAGFVENMDRSRAGTALEGLPVHWIDDVAAVLDAIETAMVSAYRRSVNASNEQQIEARVDIETGKVTIFAQKEVVEAVENEITEVELEVARQAEPEAQLGDLVIVESTPGDFGRVAAQTARQVIQQRIRDAERKAQVGFYEKQLGEIVSGVVQAVGASGLTIGLEMKTEASMPRKEMIPGERFHIHDRVRALVAEVKDSQRGPQIILSRTHRDFLRRLLENEVPEIFHGIVEKAGNDARYIEVHLGERVGNLKRVNQIGLAGKTDLAGVGRCGKNIGLLNEPQVSLLIVGGNLVKDIIDANNGFFNHAAKFLNVLATRATASSTSTSSTAPLPGETRNGTEHVVQLVTCGNSGVRAISRSMSG